MSELKEIGGFIVSGDLIVQHDNTLSGNGTVNSPLSVMPGYNETVLYSGTPKTYGGTSSGEDVLLSENISGFDRLRFYVNIARKTQQNANTTFYECSEIDTLGNNYADFQFGPFPEGSVTGNWMILRAHITGNQCGISAAYTPYTSAQVVNWGNRWFPGSLYKIVGINRKV